MLNLRHLTISRSVPAFSARLWSFTVLLGECEMALWSKTPEVADVVSFLASTPDLSQLQLHLRNLRGSDDY